MLWSEVALFAETLFDKAKGGFVITYGLSKASADAKADFIANAKAIHKTT